ncbi:MAG: rhomboid family intramembrane serine protease [Chloroflexota bacterium]
MIPISDSQRVHGRPWVNYVLIAACLLVFLYQVALGPALESFIRRWAVIPVLVTSALAGDPRIPPTTVLTLFTAAFLHGGWLHLGSNMLFLWVFGDNVEERFGHVRYALFYLLCGAGANFAQVLAGPGSSIPLIGASGAIAAVLGAYIVMFPGARVTVLVPVFFFPLFFAVPAVLMLGIWFVTQLASGLASITAHAQMTGGVGYWAHIGGFALGALVTPLLPKARTREQVYRPLTVAPPRTLRQMSPLGAAAIRVVSIVGDVVSLLIGLRIVAVLLNLPDEGPLSPLVQLLLAVTWPLVEPFTGFLPLLEFDGRILELFSLLAFLVYYALVAMVVWAIGLASTRRRGA